jgi:hypothetical protein
MCGLGSIVSAMGRFESTPSQELYGKITRKNLDVVRRDYGDGGPESPKEYHNELHTLGVMENVKKLIAAWNKEFPDDLITARDEMLLEIAASGHDRVQNARERIPDARPGDNERLSAEDVIADMREAGGYSEKDTALVRAAILGTIPEFGKGKLGQPMTETRQMLESGEITEYQFELAKILADADLGNLGQGTQEFGEWTMRLFKELKKNPEELKDFLQDEKSILETHTWVSKVGAQVFPYKQESIDAIKKILEEI